MFNRYESQLIVRTLTCNKLSHCLFDFDCVDFNVYEQESYNYQQFLFKNMRHHQYIDQKKQPSDFLMTRDGIKVTCTPIISNQLKLKWKNQVVLRFLMKHQDGRLWAYNKPFLDQTYFSEMPDSTGQGVVKTIYRETKAKREADEDEENDVDLSRSMWLIIRKKRSINQVLKDFFPDYQQQMVRVRDIIKFGRVNFKISALQCDRIDPIYNGTCYQPPNTTRQGREKSQDDGDVGDQEDDTIGPSGPKNLNQVLNQQANQLNRIGTSMLLLDNENSIDANQNLTEMNMVNDATGLSQIASQQNLNNEFSQVTLTNANADQTQSQVLLEGAESASLPQRQAASGITRNAAQSSVQTLPIVKKPTGITGGGTGGPPDKDLSMQSQSDLNKLNLGGGNVRLNEHSGSDESGRQMVCRICLSEHEPGNQLICPCKCSGSMGQIHVKCLKEWLNSKRLVYEGTKVTSYFWKALECELCKEPFENKMRSSMFAIMQFDKPEKNYMILESIKSAPAKVVHVFDLRYDSFKVGRSVETDMKIADISVSRTHSFFKVKDNKIVVEDNGSKFGTLVKLQRPVDLLNVKGEITSTIFQVGRTLIFLQLQTQRHMTYQCQRGPPNNLNQRSPLPPQQQNSSATTSPQKQANGKNKDSESQSNLPYDNYLQLRKDAMRIPMQFFFKSRMLPDENAADAATGNDYFSFNGVATEEGKEGENGNNRGRNGGRFSGGANPLQNRQSSGGHPLVPRLNLPRPDPNDQWREMMAQAQSYEVESSSLQNSNQYSSSSQYEEESSEDEEDSESEESEESYSQSISRQGSIAKSKSQSKQSKKSHTKSKKNQNQAISQQSSVAGQPQQQQVRQTDGTVSAADGSMAVGAIAGNGSKASQIITNAAASSQQVLMDQQQQQLQQQNLSLNQRNDGAILIKEEQNDEVEHDHVGQSNLAIRAEESKGSSGQYDQGQEEEKAFVIQETRKRKIGGKKLSKTQQSHNNSLYKQKVETEQYRPPERKNMTSMMMHQSQGRQEGSVGGPQTNDQIEARGKKHANKRARSLGRHSRSNSNNVAQNLHQVTNLNKELQQVSAAGHGSQVLSKSIKPNNMADLEQALDINAHKLRELPSDNIQTLNVKDTKGKARISRTRISHGAVAIDSRSSPNGRLIVGEGRLDNSKAEENDQFIFDYHKPAAGSHQQHPHPQKQDDDDGNNPDGRLILEDVVDDDENQNSGVASKSMLPPDHNHNLMIKQQAASVDHQTSSTNIKKNQQILQQYALNAEKTGVPTTMMNTASEMIIEEVKDYKGGQQDAMAGVTEVTKLQSNILDQKGPQRVPEALNLLVLETVSDQSQKIRKKAKKDETIEVEQQDQQQQLHASLHQSQVSEIRNEQSFIAAPHEQPESPHVFQQAYSQNAAAAASRNDNQQMCQMYDQYLENQVDKQKFEPRMLQQQQQMLVEDLEDSGGNYPIAGVINERLEAANDISRHVDIVSALGESNIVSNRVADETQTITAEPAVIHSSSNAANKHKNEQAFFSYSGAGGAPGSSPAPVPSKAMNLSYVSQTNNAVNNNVIENNDAQQVESRGDQPPQQQPRINAEANVAAAAKFYDTLEGSGDIHSSSVQSTYPQNPDKNLQQLPKKMLITDIHNARDDSAQQDENGKK